MSKTPPPASATGSPSPVSPSLDRVAVALDTPDADQYRRWCAFFGPRVGVLKVGLEAFVRWGPPAVEEAVRHGRRVFLDLKLHDIPATVAGAVAAAADLEVGYLTIHAGGGPAMLRAAVESAAGRVELLGVTLLTHLDVGELGALNLPGEGARRVERWAGLAADSGCSGVVCSPHEVATLRSHHPAPFRLVTPGIRPRGSARDDQRRIATPGEALAAGSDLLVIGRPLTRAGDPGAALAALEEELVRELR